MGIINYVSTYIVKSHLKRGAKGIFHPISEGQKGNFTLWRKKKLIKDWTPCPVNWKERERERTSLPIVSFTRKSPLSHLRHSLQQALSRNSLSSSFSLVSLSLTQNLPLSPLLFLSLHFSLLYVHDHPMIKTTGSSTVWKHWQKRLKRCIPSWV